MNPLKVVSLFDGIGGFTLAFQRAGMQIVAVVEIDDKARSVTARHFPDVPQFADVREVGAHNLPACDVVCGGFPCQDLSVAGKRLGFEGTRSSLFFEMVRIVNELRPAFLVWENVPGLLSSNNGRDFAAVLMALDGIGYHGAWTMLDAQFFGVAQRRRRVFGVFARADIGAGRCAEILSLANRSAGHFETGARAGQDVAAPVVSRTGKGGFTDPVNDNRAGKYAGSLSGTRVDAIAFQQNQRNEVRELGDVVGAINSEPGMHNQNFVAQATSEISPTLESGEQIGVRRLTPVECERLQGFPDGWTAGQADSTRYRQLGNAVAVPVVEWIGRNLVRVSAFQQSFAADH